MTEHASLLAHVSLARRARSVLASCGMLKWLTDAASGSTPFFDNDGAPTLLTTEPAAAELFTAGAGRVVLDHHPRVASVQLAGRFWPVAGQEAAATLDAVHRDHADCPGCLAGQLTRVLRMQVVSVSARLPDERDYRAIPFEDYETATVDAMVAMGATIASHLNQSHRDDLARLTARLLGVPANAIGDARAGAVGSSGFELCAVDYEGAHLLTVPVPHPPRDPMALPDAIHDAIVTAADGSLEPRDG